MIASTDDDHRRDTWQPPPQIQVVAQGVQCHDPIEVAAWCLRWEMCRRRTCSEQQTAILNGAAIGQPHPMAGWLERHRALMDHPDTKLLLCASGVRQQLFEFEPPGPKLLQRWCVDGRVILLGNHQDVGVWRIVSRL